MIATFINAGLVLLGSLLGLLFKRFISDRFTSVVTHALALCVMSIGISMAVKTANTLCVIICMVLGTLLGELLNIEKRLDGAGEFLRRKLIKNDGGKNSRFTEGFVNASLLFCVGAMAITGSIEAGLNHNYSIIVSKGVIDGVSSITFAATMGIGVVFSIIPVIAYQGAITLLAAVVGPYLGDAVILEMSAVGGIAIMGIAVNMLNIPKLKIKVGNMLPAIFLPIVYIPLANWLTGLVG
ncbi:MAG: DUF554 domain-containing protein [Oscillospiraceae bacterium]